MRTERYIEDCGSGDGELIVEFDNSGRVVRATYTDKAGTTVATGLEAKDWLESARRRGERIE